MHELVKVNHLSFSYSRNPILSDISFSLQEEDFTILTGSNGAGKSTLFNLILGFLKSKNGEVKVMGEDPQKNKNYIAYIPQQTTLASFSLKVIDVVASSFLTQRSFFFCGNKHDKQKSFEILDKLGLVSLAKVNFNTLSGGQIQKVMLARALANPKPILLLDEPMANIDYQSKQFIYEVLKNLKKLTAIIMITHDISFLSEHKGKVLYLNNGCLTQYESSQEMEQNFFHNHKG